MVVRFVQCCYLSLALLLQTGCIKLWEVRENLVPDPQQQEYRKVATAQGRSFSLEDGRSYLLAGVDLSGTRVADERDCLKHLIGKYVLVVADHDGKARIVTGGGPDWRPPGPHVFCRVFPVFVLIPITVDKPPDRVDVALELIKAGGAQVVPEEIHDWLVRQRYVDAQAEALARAWGIWHYHHWDPNGMSAALGYAILENKLDEAHYLLERSPGRLPGKDLLHCLIWMVDNAKTDGVSLLLEHGAPVNGVEPRIGTPLLRAVIYSVGNVPETGHAATVQLLLAHGAQVNQRGPDGGTALHAAAHGGNARIVELLLAAGADPTIRTNPTADHPQGQTPLEIATAMTYVQEGYRWKPVVHMLERRKAKPEPPASAASQQVH